LPKPRASAHSVRASRKQLAKCFASPERGAERWDPFGCATVSSKQSRIYRNKQGVSKATVATLLNSGHPSNPGELFCERRLLRNHSRAPALPEPSRSFPTRSHGEGTDARARYRRRRYGTDPPRFDLCSTRRHLVLEGRICWPDLRIH
jgi:hypothetical protein